VKPPIQPLRDGDPKSFQGWTLKGFIAEGGQSTIYLAEKDHKQVALKVIKKENLHDQLAVERFFTEIKNLELLDHPRIARYVESNTSSGVPYFAVEYINGLNLEKHIESNGPMEGVDWFQLALSLAEVITYCHSQGILHKDLSPRNIVIEDSGPVLIDFGLSYLEKDPRLTGVEQVAGTRPFMSPEHFGAARPKEMDNFSLAGTLIFAATGHYPFSGSNDTEWRESILYNRPDFSGLSENQIQVLAPLLYKNPEQRGSLLVFSQLISDLLAGDLASNLVKKEFAKVKRDSQRKLIQVKKQLSVKKTTIKKIASAAAVVTLLSAGLASYGIVQIQNRGVIAESSASDAPGVFPSSSTSPTSVNSNPEISATSNPRVGVTSSSRACQDEFDRKGTNIISLCLPFAEKGDLASIFHVGVTYFDKKNYKEAEKWLLMGAKRKDLNSTKFLIETYTELSNTAERDRWTKICADTSYGATDTSPLKDIAYCKMMHGFVLNRAGATKEAILYLTDAADYGSGDAATWLGVYYRDLGQKDKAVSWLTKSAELGNSKGLNALISYADEIGDDKLAEKWLLVSANDGNQVNMGLLAYIYYFDKKLVDAKKWAVKGAGFGDILSTFVQGALTYDQGQKAEGKAILTKAADKGNIPAMRKLGTIYRLDEKNFSQAAIWYEKLAARNDFTGTAIYSSLLIFLGKDEESCVFNDKVLELGNQAKKNGTYEPAIMDEYMTSAKKTYDSWCSKLYKNN
jgi:serine/threonine protein kinase/tetratricopeptide (TPR) repeat protein